MRGIRCSGKLVHPNQTNDRDAEREMGFFHAVIYEGTERFVQFENQVRRFGYAMTASQPSCLTARFTFDSIAPLVGVGWGELLGGGVPWLATMSSHLVTKLHHAALIGFDLRQMEGDVSVELLKERYPIANQDRQDRITHFVG
jgi:hypothetical protein